MNIGSMLILLTWLMLLYAIYPVIKYLAPASRQIESVRRKLSQNIFWNGIILFVQEAYLDLAICGLINCLYFSESWDRWAVFFSNLVAVLLLLAVATLPIFLIAYIYPRYDQLTDEKMQSKYFSAYEMIDLKDKPEAVFWCILFCLRRLFFALGVVLMVQYPVL